MSRKYKPMPYFVLSELIADFQEAGGEPTTHYTVQHVDAKGQPTTIVKTLCITKDGRHIAYSQNSCFLGMKPHMNYQGRYGRKGPNIDLSDMWTAEASMTNDEAREFFYSFIDIERGDVVEGRNNIDGTHWCEYRGKRSVA